MRHLLAALLVVAMAPAWAATELLELEVSGTQRRVLLHLPDRLPASASPALVVLFHGLGDDARPFARAVDLHRDWPEAIIAYPSALPARNRRMRAWQTRAGQHGDRDLLLVDHLLETMARRHGTRPEASFAAGFSNGGNFVLLLARERPAAFAALAVIGSVEPGFTSTVRPRPLLYLFGRGEDARLADDWRRTVEALVRHQRTRGPLQEVLGCCHRQMPDQGGAPFVFGTYKAGHVWPSRANAWLRAFFTGAQGSG